MANITNVLNTSYLSPGLPHNPRCILSSSYTANITTALCHITTAMYIKIKRRTENIDESRCIYMTRATYAVY